MAFTKGQSGNPAGRPKGSVGGRHALLMELDAVAAEPEVKARFIEALREAFLKEPLTTFRTFIAPLLPKSIELGGEIGIEGVHELVRELARKVNDSGRDRESGQ